MDGWMGVCACVRACMHGLVYSLSLTTWLKYFSINGNNQSDGCMYVRISLYKQFLFGLMDMRIYVSTTGV